MLPIFWPVGAQELEMALVPIAMTSVTIPGGHGSQWKTAFVAYNSSDNEVFVRYLDALCLHISPCPEGVMLDPNHVSRRFRWAQGPDAGSSTPHGVLIYYAPEEAEDLHFHLRIRDITREAESAGTEIPVVRETEFRSEAIHLLEIPTAAPFRSHLRLYGPDGVGGSFLISFFDQDTNLLIAQEEIVLEPHVSGFSRFFPDYAEIARITERHPALQNSDHFRIAIEPIMPGFRFWAFVSITNNETQQVTVVTPQ